jgi:hypothetical protein
MLPTLAERLREQHAKTRGRRPSRPPWPVPGEPPTALLFQVRAEPASAAVAAMAEPDPGPPVSDAVVMAIPTPVAPLAPPTPLPSRPVPERTALAELLVVLIWAVLVVIDGALALASLIDGAAGRPRRPQASAAAAPPSAAPPFLMAASAP